MARRGEKVTRPRTTRRSLYLACAALAGGLLLLGGGALLRLEGSASHVLLLGGLALALAALWVLVTLFDSHFDDLERLAGDLLVLRDGEPLPARWSNPAWSTPETRRVAQSVNQALGAEHLPGAPHHEQRLAAVVAALDEGLLLLTGRGLVSLINAPAAALFPSPPQVGTSGLRLFEAESLARAEAAARGGPAAVTLALPDGGSLRARARRVTEADGAGAEQDLGLLLVFPAAQPLPGRLQHDLALHDEPPEAAAADDTPLAALPVVVLDGETTGLEVARDRLVSLAAVRMHGVRVYPQRALDRLVNPGCPIPRAATAVHGISDPMVERAETAAALLPAVADFIGGRVVVGHNIGFDLALLAAEAQRAGLPWHRPRWLDTGQLAAALDPGLKDLNLENLARRYDLPLKGRHTALGDCLLTAAVWRRLLRELEARGVATLAQAEAFAGGAGRLIRLQRQAGWVVPD